jgi:hypothetical protein
MDKSASRRRFLQHMTALGALGSASAGVTASGARAAEPGQIAQAQPGTTSTPQTRASETPITPLPIQRTVVQMGALRSRSGRAMEQRAGNAAWRFRARYAALSWSGSGHGTRGRLRALSCDRAPRERSRWALLAYERARAPRARAAVLGSRERARENHLASPWSRLKRDVKFALRERFSRDKTVFHTAWLYGYDVGRELQ